MCPRPKVLMCQVVFGVCGPFSLNEDAEFTPVSKVSGCLFSSVDTRCTTERSNSTMTGA